LREKARKTSLLATQPMFYHHYNDLCLNNNPNIWSSSIDGFFKEFVDFFSRCLGETEHIAWS